MKKVDQEKLKIIYQKAYSFLLSQDGVNKKLLEQHLKPECKRYPNIESIFKRFCASAQNKQMSSKVIGDSINGIENLKKVVFNFNPYKTAQYYQKNSKDKLLDNVITKLNPSGQIRKTSRSLWPQFCQTVIDSAHFLSQFESSKEFYKWADLFLKDSKTKPALPLMVSLEIRGFGFPLACDVLKEIGYSEFGKPDIHLKDIFKALNLIDAEEKNNLKQDYEILKMIDKIAEANKTTSYAVDKIFWLIGSGNFYLEGINIGRNKQKFIASIK